MKERFTCLDTETTGLEWKDGDRVIEIGIVEVVGNVVTGRNLHLYINPGRRKVHEEAFKIHNISDDFLRDKPPMNDVAQEFLNFIGNDPIVIHNAPFDMGFLNNEFDLIGRPRIKNEIIDSLSIARRMYPGARNSLDALCQRYGIDKSSRTYHGALIDSELLAFVYISMMGFNALDLGDHPIRNVSAESKREVSSALPYGRIARPRREPLMPSEDEMAAHAAFVAAKIKNPLWSNFQ